MSEREHVTTGLDCWCGPVRLAYGDEPVYDDEGGLVAVIPDPSMEEG